MELLDPALNSPGSTGRMVSQAIGWLSSELGPQSSSAFSLLFHDVDMRCGFNGVVGSYIAWRVLCGE